MRTFTTVALALAVTCGVTQGATITFENNDGITIPASGAGTPNPSTINVAGMGLITDISVTFSLLSHTWPDDLDILLVGPTGASVILMSDAGATFDISNVTLTFDLAAVTFLPDSGQIVSGTYRPTNYGDGDTFPAPAPDGPYGSLLSAFLGTNPNGIWSLYVMDDTAGDSGSMGGWSITLSDDGAAIPEPGTWGLMSAGMAGLAWLGRRRALQQ